MESFDVKVGSDAPSARHIGPLRATRPLLARVMSAVGHGLQQIRTARQLSLVELAFGFVGSAVPPIIVAASEAGVSVRSSSRKTDALAATEGWVALPDPVDEHEIATTAWVRGGSAERIESLSLSEAERDYLAAALHQARIDHCFAIAADSPDEWQPHEPEPVENAEGELVRDSRSWIYDLFSHLPALVGADHSVALILPDNTFGPTGVRHYIVAAERLFILEDERPPAHLVGLHIPVGDGRGGLLEATLSQHASASTRQPWYLYVPAESVGDDDETPRAWRVLDFSQEEPTLYPRFAVAQDFERPDERMLMLAPLTLPMHGLGFIALNYRQPCALASSTSMVIERLALLVSEALAQSDLFRLPLHRLSVLEALGVAATDGVCSDRSSFVSRILPELAHALGAETTAIGLMTQRDGEEVLVFDNPQGWDLDEPTTIRFRTADSLAALAIRMRRPILLAGGHPVDPQTPAVRWTNSLYVNESLGLILDGRHPWEDGESVVGASGWRPLSDYYKPTATNPVYVGLSIPLIADSDDGDGEVIGVLSMDFGRDASWDTYSGFGTEALYRALARLLTSHLLLLAPGKATRGGHDGS